MASVAKISGGLRKACSARYASPVWLIKCIGMSNETYKYLKKEECKDLHWFCTGCSNDAVNNSKMLMNLHSKQEKMTTEMVTLKFSVLELEINVNNIILKSISRIGKWKEC